MVNVALTDRIGVKIVVSISQLIYIIAECAVNFVAAIRSAIMPIVSVHPARPSAMDFV